MAAALQIAGWIVFALALVATGATIRAGFALRAFARTSLPSQAEPRPVTLLKPLHGAEPRLAENLAGFLDQDWTAPIQLVAGVNDADDHAFAIARALAGKVTVTTDAPRIGANAKVANLANMVPAAAHDLIVLSDSDIAVKRDYLSRVIGALDQPGIGAVTCLYRGRGVAGWWSRFAACGITWHFASIVALSISTGIEQPCMGSTIALRRATLDAIGGFAAFTDTLADDHAIGAAVRKLGLDVIAAPRLFVTHDCGERSLTAVWRHELRWAGTLRAIGPLAHLGSGLTHPLAWALIGIVFHPLAAGVLTLISLGARIWVAHTANLATKSAPAPLVWLPARDLFSFAVFVASFFVRRVDWRGQRLRMGSDGRIVAARS